MVNSTDDDDLLGVSGGKKYGKGSGNVGKVLDTALGYAGKRKCGGDELLGADLSGGSFEGDRGDNLEGAGPAEGDPLGI